MLRCICLLLFLTGAQATAGAWPRQEHTAFSSVATQLNFGNVLNTAPSYNSAYLEYGLNGTHTLGLDAGRSSDGTFRAIAFLRMPWTTTKTGNPVAAELGLGIIESQVVIRPGLSWGRGLKNGWLAADAQTELGQSGHFSAKLDMTLGLKDKRGRMLILQLQNSKAVGEAVSAKFVPSVVIPFGKKRHLEIGGSTTLIGQQSYGIKFGLWRDF
jgi:hypothetical protein